MRFAEDMLLNAKMYGLQPYARCDEDNNRCALGLVETYQSGQWHRPIIGAEQKYPWLMEVKYVVPCECDFQPGNSYRVMFPAIVAHLFNEHVMQGFLSQSYGKGPVKPWTLEQLADWIESIDPTPRETSEHIEQPTDLQTFLEAVNTKA